MQGAKVEEAVAANKRTKIKQKPCTKTDNKSDRPAEKETQSPTALKRARKSKGTKVKEIATGNKRSTTKRKEYTKTDNKSHRPAEKGTKSSLTPKRVWKTKGTKVEEVTAANRRSTSKRKVSGSSVEKETKLSPTPKRARKTQDPKLAMKSKGAKVEGLAISKTVSVGGDTAGAKGNGEAPKDSR